MVRYAYCAPGDGTGDRLGEDDFWELPAKLLPDSIKFKFRICIARTEPGSEDSVSRVFPPPLAFRNEDVPVIFYALSWPEVLF